MDNAREVVVRRTAAAVLIASGAAIAAGTIYATSVVSWPCALGVALIGAGAVIAVPDTSILGAVVIGALSPGALFALYFVGVWVVIIFLAIVGALGDWLAQT